MCTLIYSKQKWIGFVVIGVLLAGCGDKKETPPTLDTVANYINGEITV